MQKNERFIVNREILPKGKIGGVDWFKTKEIEVYFTDNNKSYILKVEDVIKESKKPIKVLLSYDAINYKKYIQGGQILNGNLETMFNYFDIQGSKIRPYRLSEDGTYWIGNTHDNIEFYFNGEHSEEIMKNNWRISNGYLITTKQRKDTRLNRMVLGVTDRNIVVNHRGGNKMDNRVEMLSISDHEDNMKELLPSILNNTGITGLSYNEKNNKYNIVCSVNDVRYADIYIDRDEALKDLLIIQRHYGYRHNENLYYMLDNIDNQHINKLIDKVENKISTYKVKPIICKNRFELSEDGSFYWMYDKDNNRCKISVEDLELVKQGNWHHISNNGKDYFSGSIIYEGKRKGIFLHRFLFDLIDPKYRHWYIDHLDSDGLNNTRENMIITDAKGNGLNKKRTYTPQIKNGKYQYMIKTHEKIYYKSFDNERDGIIWMDKIYDKLLKTRIQFKSKYELNKYIKEKAS